MGKYFSREDIMRIPEEWSNIECSEEEKKEIEEKMNAYFQSQIEKAKKYKSKKKSKFEILSVKTNESNNQVEICFKPRVN